MAKQKRIEYQARQLCRHTVCFTDAQSRLIVARAIQGIATKAIAEELEITESKVQYAILKAQHLLGIDVRFRRDYRNGNSVIAKKMVQETQDLALQIVSRKIAPKMIKFAATGVSRMAA